MVNLQGCPYVHAAGAFVHQAAHATWLKARFCGGSWGSGTPRSRQKGPRLAGKWPGAGRPLVVMRNYEPLSTILLYALPHGSCIYLTGADWLPYGPCYHFWGVRAGGHHLRPPW